MKAKSLLLAVLLVVFSTGAMAVCQQGTTRNCTINGKPGKKECFGTGYGPCEPIESPPPPPVTGTVTLKYKVLTVLYAPPGTNGGSSTSQVSYGSGSTTGSTTTLTSSFKKDYSVAVSFGFGADPSKNGASVGPSFEYTHTKTRSDALDIKKAVTKTLLVTGPGADGVDHDRDEIWLWLKPVVNISVANQAVNWSFADASQGFTQFFYAGWLKNPSTMPAAQLQALQNSGITPADYPEILKADPLAGCALVTTLAKKAAAPPIGPLPCSTPLPSGPRYVFLQQWFTYEPPFAMGDANTTTQLRFDNSLVNTSTSTSETDYKVGLSGGFSIPLATAVTFSFKTEDSLTWSDTNTAATSTGTTQSVFATVGGPAFGYRGPYNMMELYLDTTYQTFVFLPIAGPTDALRGVITKATGKPSAGTPVIAYVNGKRYLTYTDSKGSYRFGRKFTGPVKVVAGPMQQSLQKIDATKSVDFKLK